jgi:hypothetical protein
MRIIVLLALLQTPPDSVRYTSIYGKPFNDTLDLSVRVGILPDGVRTQLRIGMINRRSRQLTPLGLVHDRGVERYEVTRVDDSSMVIGRMGFYLAMPFIKLFLHPQTKVVVKQIEYQPDIGLRAVDDREVASVLEIPPHIVQQVERRPWEAKPDSSHIPAALREHPMRQSTYAEFVRARPDMKDHGLGEDTILDERPGPFQEVGSRIWLGKVFYDGEGHSGVGGLGYFDTNTSQYTWVNVPGLTGWSVSAILIEEDAAWVGLVNHPEGESYGGGLLRYDFKSRTSMTFPIDEVVYQIVRWKDRIYVATKNGASLVKGTTLARRYRVEPNIDNRFIIVTAHD